jgi:predicted metal-dependent peptidase
MNAREKITKGRTRLILDQYFFGTLAMRLSPEEVDWCETAATDGKILAYNADYIDALPMSQVVGLLAHEVMHCALEHVWRGEGKDAFRWNVACDYTINENLIRAGFTLPEGALIDPAFQGLSAEEIYHRLPQQQQGGGGDKGEGGPQGGQPGKDGGQQSKDGKQQGKDGGQQGDQQGKDGGQQSKDGKQQSKDGKGKGKGADKGVDPGKCGGVYQSKESKEEKQQLKEEWKSATAQAAEMCKNKGDLPADIRIKIKEILDPPLPWYILLRDFVERSARNDYNWAVPNRRYISQGIILPSLLSEQLPEVIIVNDTSGSTMGFQSHFAKEASGVLSAYKTTVRVIYCDAMVHMEEEYATEDLPIVLKPIGGGGTSFVPAFEYITKMGYTPSCLLFLTDLYGRFPSKAPDYPVMWITPNDQKAPFGATVKFNVKPESR